MDRASEQPDRRDWPPVLRTVGLLAGYSFAAAVRIARAAQLPDLSEPHWAMANHVLTSREG